MKVVLHDRTEDIPASLRVYTERRLSRLTRHFDRIVEAEVEFTQDTQRGSGAHQVVQIIVRLDGRKHALVRARESAPMARAALDLALDKVDRQVTRLKEKIKHERKRASALVVAPGLNGALEPPPRPAPARVRMKLRPESLEAAGRALEANGQLFHVFLDEYSGNVNIVYRRTDGSLAVIEPVIP